MKYTEKYGFMKPDVDEFYDVNVFNDNMDKVEQELINLNVGSDLEEFGQELQELQEKIEENSQEIQDIQETINGIHKSLIKTLTAGSTTLSFTDTKITSSSTIDIYTSVYGVVVKNATISGNKLTLTFKKAQTTSINVKVVIS